MDAEDEYNLPAPDEDTDSVSRVRRPTEKGKEFQFDVKLRELNRTFRHLKATAERINVLIAGNPKTRDVQTKYAEWLNLYEQFLSIHNDCNTLLGESEITDYMINVYDAKDTFLKNFKVSLENWFLVAQSNADKVHDSQSVKSHNSKHSSRASDMSSVYSSIVSARLLQEQEMAELKATMSSLKLSHEIELKKLGLRMKEKELELNTKIAIARAKSQVLERFENVNVKIESKSFDPTPTETTTLNPQVQSFIPCSSKVITKESHPQLNTVITKVVPEVSFTESGNIATEVVSKGNYIQPSTTGLGAHYNFDYNDQDDTKRDGVACHVYNNSFADSNNTTRVHPSDGAMLDVVRLMNKPTSEITCFNGDPMKYHKFLRQFHAKIVMNTDSNDERMNYLEQFTSGEASRVVSGYSHLSAEQGYPTAMRELNSRYGDIEVIANAFIQRALQWPPIKPDDVKSLDEFALFLVECQNAVESIDALRILEYSENMRRLICKLPFNYHDKWRNRVHRCRELKQPVKFKHLVAFVKEEARKVNDPSYGREALSNPQKVKSTGGQEFKFKALMHSKGSFATSQLEPTMTGMEHEEKSEPNANVYSQTNINKNTVCLHCGANSHVIGMCDHLRTLSPKDKFSQLRRLGLCFGCLKTGHLKRDCRVKATCATCNKRHPTILHFNTGEIAAKPHDHREMNTRLKESCTNSDGVCGHIGAGNRELCAMAIVPVRVKLRNRMQCVATYAFLDSDSSVSFCTENLLRKLGGHGKRMQITLDTMGSPFTMRTFAVDSLQVCNLETDDVIDLPKVFTKDRMPVSKEHIPVRSDIDKWSHLHDIQLHEIEDEIGLMIGSNVPDAYAPLQVRTGPRGSPHATRTLLGWIIWNIVRGNADLTDDRVQTEGLVNRTEIRAIEEANDMKKLENMVKESINFNFPEKLIDDRKENSQEDKKFMTLVENSVHKVNDHYCIDLPFKYPDVTMPDNLLQAQHRLSSLKRKMRKNSKFCSDYINCMNRILDGAYAEKVPEDELLRGDGRVWYIPHHGVYHHRNLNKVRVVFDCSAKYMGVSLNDQLLQGPDLTTNLLGVILRFRQDFTAIMGDIESMFYQVFLPKNNRDYVRFLWWPEGNLDCEPVPYRMRVHLFGAVSSPSCCNYALHKTITDNVGEFQPRILDVVRRNMYVDDCLTSVNTEVEAVTCIERVSALCKMGGFHLTKWTSNNDVVLESLPTEERRKDAKNSNLEPGSPASDRALEVYWLVASDSLSFRIEFKDQPLTRRGILSVVSSVYDPIGLAAPFVLTGKIMLQHLCQTRVGWDDKISNNDAKRWQEWITELPQLEQLSVPRCYKPVGFGKVEQCQIHCFSDASNEGYGIVAYLRLVNEKQDVYCAFLMGKARVAPLKKITVPRLELTAATMAVRLSKVLVDELDYIIDKVFFWTDSMTVLMYIWNESSRFHTFVANRVALIREATDVNQWKYVSTQLNPADCASRGVFWSKFQQKHQWLNGPDFLWKGESDWPWHLDVPKEIPLEDVEVKRPVCTVLVREPEGVMSRLFSVTADWWKLKKIVGWLLKAKHNLRNQIVERKSSEALERSQTDFPVEKHKVSSRIYQGEKNVMLSLDEIQRAEGAIIRYIQRQHFESEIQILTEAQQSKRSPRLRKSSALSQLNPFLDDHGIIRVGGRLERANLTYDAKHPILLPKASHVSTMILEHIHRRVGHLGKNSVLAALRQRYWLIGASSSIKSLVHRCVTCRKYQAPTTKQKMADLPSERLIADDPPFARVGVDFFGPFEIKRGRSMVKRYGVLFTCLTIRAVHIEVAHSLDSDSCSNAIRRFVARRGPVKYIRSDNGTNLVAAERVLREEIQSWNTDKIRESCYQKGIDRNCNPPAASHFGGIWERMIRTARIVMYSIMQEQPIHLDDESLQTLFCEIEAIMNNRPITESPNSPNDLEAITPNHLLLLQSGECFPPGTFDKRDNYVRRRWRQVQYLADLFWSRWIKEYLPMLQQRQKWLHPSKNLKVGDIVMIADEAPRNSWCLGRILDVIEDKHGLVRSAKVKTKTTTLHRPVTKLCLIVEHDLDN